MPALAYLGVRQPSGATDVVAIDDFAQPARPLDPRLDLARHSPDGFEWGHRGGGSAQLALALLADHLADDALALELCQAFGCYVTARLDRPIWSLRVGDIDIELDRLGLLRLGRTR